MEKYPDNFLSENCPRTSSARGGGFAAGPPLWPVPDRNVQAIDQPTVKARTLYVLLL
jgi:hypothetical protein